MSPKNRNPQSPYGIQAPAAKYWRHDYLTPQRLSSLGWQYQLSVELGVRSFIEVGPGNNLLSSLLQSQGRLIFSIDHNHETNPDIQALLPFLPVSNGAVDASLCFQVLEHMPYALLKELLLELTRISKYFVVISLPDQTVHLSCKNKFKRVIYQKYHFPKRWEPPAEYIDPEHFWEIGHHDISATSIIDLAKGCNLQLVKHFRNEFFPYHHFFIFRHD